MFRDEVARIGLKYDGISVFRQITKSRALSCPDRRHRLAVDLIALRSNQGARLAARLSRTHKPAIRLGIKPAGVIGPKALWQPQENSA
jgi:hypothetical protein